MSIGIGYYNQGMLPEAIDSFTAVGSAFVRSPHERARDDLRVSTSAYVHEDVIAPTTQAMALDPKQMTDGLVNAGACYHLLGKFDQVRCSGAILSPSLVCGRLAAR
jgi:hypothetical protein